MRSYRRRIVVPLLVTLLLLTSAAVPAAAANKLFESHDRGVVLPLTDVPETICGVEVARGELILTNERVVVWDDGRFLLQWNNTTILYDEWDRPIVRDRFSLRFVEGPGDRELEGESFQFHEAHRLVAVCTGHSATPGKHFESYFSVTARFTVIEGAPVPVVRQIRFGPPCDPDVYAPCDPVTD